MYVLYKEIFMKINLKERKLEEVNTESMKDLLSEYNKEQIDLKDNIFYQQNKKLLNLLRIEDIDNSMFKENYPDISFPEKVDINVIFIPDILKEEVLGYVNVDINEDQDLLGVALISACEGLFEEYNSYSAKEFSIIVFCEENEKLKKQINMELYPEEYVYKLMNTLTHEIWHHLLFLESSGGLSPNEVEIWSDMEVFDNNIDDCIYGKNNDLYEDFYISNPDKEQYVIMETIVENNGLELLDTAKLNFYDLVKSFTENKKDKKVRNILK